MKWEKSIRLEKGGLRAFREVGGDRWAVADNSGRTPDETDDGVLWLDFTRPLDVELREYSVVVIPVLDAGRHGLLSEHSFVSAGVTTLAKLRELFPTWRVEIGPRVAKLLAALANPSDLADDEGSRCVSCHEPYTKKDIDFGRCPSCGEMIVASFPEAKTPE